MEIPDYVVQRIRSGYPSRNVIPQSTPVLAFGPFQMARVATLGINPSKHEFLDKAGHELQGAQQRFETLTSLAIATLASADQASMAKIVAGCNRYFATNPYRRWFDQLEPMINAAGASYYDGSACHLDLVQWATDPIWRDLSRTEQDALLQSDTQFLKAQLAVEQITTLLLNGRRVITEFEQRLGGALHIQREVAAHGRTQLFIGQYGPKMRVIGWSVNIQSSFGVTRDMRATIAAFVKEFAG